MAFSLKAMREGFERAIKQCVDSGARKEDVTIAVFLAMRGGELPFQPTHLLARLEELAKDRATVAVAQASDQIQAIAWGAGAIAREIETDIASIIARMSGADDAESAEDPKP